MVSSDLFLDIADAYAWRSTCLRRRFGSVIIDARFDDPIAGGFNGAPRGMEHCTDVCRCLRDELNVKEGERYELCLHKNTVVKLLNGEYKTIEELSITGEDVWLYGIDQTTYKIIPVKGINPRLTGHTDTLVEIKFSKSGSLKCTPEHRIMMRDGSWKQAKDLQVNDRVMPIYYNRIVNTTNGKLYEKISNAIKCRVEGGRVKLNYEPTYGVSTHSLVYSYFFPERILDYDNFVHHKDENSLNNLIDNLEYINRSDHTRNHEFYKYTTLEQKQEVMLRIVANTKNREETDPEFAQHMYECRKRNMEVHWNDPEWVARHKERSKISGAKLAAKTNSNPDAIASRAKSKVIKGIYELGIRSGKEVTVDNYEQLASEYPVAAKLGQGGNKVPRIKTVLKWFSSLQEAIDIANEQNHKVESIIFIKCNNEPVYCLTVPEHENFAVDMGDNSCIIVHNCRSSHAEQNAMIKAGNRAYGCTLYLVGWDAKTNKRIVPKPCFLCTKMMINAGIEKVVTHYAIYDPVELYNDYLSKLWQRTPSSEHSDREEVNATHMYS
jgi:deoxycytidylate deaminase